MSNHLQMSFPEEPCWHHSANANKAFTFQREKARQEKWRHLQERIGEQPSRREEAGLKWTIQKVDSASERSRRTSIIWRRLPGRGDSCRALKCGQASVYCKCVSTLWWQGLGRKWAGAERGAHFVEGPRVGFFSPFPPPPRWSKLSSPLTWTTTEALQLFSLRPLLPLYNSFCTQKLESKKLIMSFS